MPLLAVCMALNLLTSATRFFIYLRMFGSKAQGGCEAVFPNRLHAMLKMAHAT